MKYIVAVSGGVDSIVLLHILAKKYGASSLVIAHFDHGIREASSRDAQFVADLAEDYGCVFETTRVVLGAEASEEAARAHRYEFLKSVCIEHKGILVTAHHLDDLVETVVLHLQRGTGWRGLTPFGQAIERPLLRYTKSEIFDYAHHHGLRWVEDETNTDPVYARNKIRPLVERLPFGTKREIAALYARQWEIRKEIDAEVVRFEERMYSRYWYISLSDVVRDEFVRSITRGLLTRPQMRRLALAICTARPGATYEAGSGVKVTFTTRTFTLELLKLE